MVNPLHIKGLFPDEIAPDSNLSIFKCSLEKLRAYPVYRFLFDTLGVSAVLNGTAGIETLGQTDVLPFSCPREAGESDLAYLARYTAYLIGGINGPSAFVPEPQGNNAGFDMFFDANRFYQEKTGRPLGGYNTNRWGFEGGFGVWYWALFDFTVYQADWNTTRDFFMAIRDTPLAPLVRCFWTGENNPIPDDILERIDPEKLVAAHAIVDSGHFNYRFHGFFTELLEQIGVNIQDLEKTVEEMRAKTRFTLSAAPAVHTRRRSRDSMLILPYEGEILGEVRTSYYLAAFGIDPEKVRIVAFGRCNYRCPYCIRDGQDVNPDGTIAVAQECSRSEVFGILDEALQAGQRARLSGGDPSMFPKDSLEIGAWSMAHHGKGLTYCHNGSAPGFVEKMLPYTSYAAIDLKGSNPYDLAMRAGIKEALGSPMLQKSLQCQRILSEAGIPLDVRTCVFGSTTAHEMFVMADLIAKSGDPSRKVWTVRQYNSVPGIPWQPPHPERLQENIQFVSTMHPELTIAFRPEWQGGGLQFWRGGRLFTPPTVSESTLSL